MGDLPKVKANMLVPVSAAMVSVCCHPFVVIVRVALNYLTLRDELKNYARLVLRCILSILEEPLHVLDEVAV